MKLTSVAASLLTAALVSFAAPSYATLVTCPEPGFSQEPNAKVEDGTGTVSATSQCQYISPPDNSNTASIENINAAGFFGHSDWTSNGQTQLEGAGQTGGSGSWSIASPDFSGSDYIIVFKDGSGTNLIAFLFNELFSSGVWSTPFTEPPFDLSGGSTAHDVSHLTIAKREGGGGGEQQESEPNVLALLGLGLLMFGFLRRRKHTA